MHEKIIKRYAIIYGLIAGLVAIGLFLIMSGIANAEVWYRPDKATMAWDPVTTDIDGDPIPVGSIIVYDVYLAYSGQQFKQTIEPIEATEFTFTFPTDYKGVIYGCAEALQVDKAQWNASPRSVDIQDRSVVVCSSQPAYVDPSIGEAWGWMIWAPPANPGGLRPK